LQLATYCHLKLIIPPVILGCFHETYNAPAYQISAQSGNAWPNYY